METNIVDMPVDDVIVRNRVREDDGDLETLEASIRNIGLICPIIVDSKNVLISGGRRLQACKNIAQESIMACRLGIDASSLKALDIQGDENLCRLPLTNDEIEKHIELKKRTASGKTGSRGDFIAGIKKMIGSSK